MATRASWEARTRSANPGDRPGSGADEHLDLVRVLGPDHPLAQAQRAVATTTGLAVDASALLIAAPCLVVVSPEVAVAVDGSAALVAAALWGVVAVLRAHRRRCVHDLILDGRAPPLFLARSEIRRLVDPARCAGVARTLDVALHAGEHWHEYLPASRPPPGVCHLPPNGPLIREITSCLRSGQVSPRAMVMLERLVRGGYGAAVYQGGTDWMRRELGRIRFELAEQAGCEDAAALHGKSPAAPV